MTVGDRLRSLHVGAADVDEVRLVGELVAVAGPVALVPRLRELREHVAQNRRRIRVMPRIVTGRSVLRAGRASSTALPITAAKMIVPPMSELARAAR